ncbi:sugar phosphate nucleotidyltransferase [Clostridium chromiireducens]|nr:sugar phosphate nucleotidyltransferase [Clostridium chromiireducens]
MNNRINLIMPMAGKGSRFSKNGFEFPKPLIEINGKPFFYWATQSIRKFIELKSIIFVVLEEHIERFSIDKEIMRYFPEAKIKVIPEVLNGAVLTCIEGIKDINNGYPIIFNDCDHLFISQSFYDYCNKGGLSKVDGALLTFKSNESKFSYLECDRHGHVIRTVEKVVISNDAICGTYCFKNKSIFMDSAQEYLRVCNYNEYFVSGIYNVMAERGKIVNMFTVDKHLSFGTPEEYNIALDSKDFEVLL